MNDYKIHMQQVNSDNTLGVLTDLEKDFPGLKYLKCEGLETKGKPYIYTEKYADSDELRVYIPEQINREPTTIILSLCFVGEKRRDAYNDFYEYVKKGKFKYWDTVRNKEALLVLTNEVSPKEDLLKGSMPFIEVDFKFQNLYGATKKHT